MPRIGKADEPTEVSWDYEADLVVVGGGGAGFCAGIEAAEAGCTVLILEKNSWCGGDSYMCGGHIMCAGSHLQEELAGVTDDSGEKFAEDIIRWGQGLVNEDMVREMCMGSAEAVEWMESLGRTFTRIEYASPIRQFDPDGEARRRIVVSDGAYYGVHFPPLEEKLNSYDNATVLTNTPATHLVRNAEGRVIGVEATDEDGNVIHAKANKGVVISTAGSDHDMELAKSLSHQQYWGLKMFEAGMNNPNCIDTIANTGDGVRMCMEVGADLAVSTACVMQDTHYIGGVGNYGMHEALGLEMNPYQTTVYEGNICVGPDGRRFVQEDAEWGYVMQKVARKLEDCGLNYEKLDKFCYNICDADHYETTWVNMGLPLDHVVSADTIEELAEKLGMPAENLAKTIADWNSYSDNQNDLEYGRWGDWGQIATPPFYADPVQPGVLGTAAGVKCDIDTHVIDVNGNPIPGLYAAGMTAGGNYTPPFYPGCGWAILGTIVWGRKAGKVVAAAEPAE